MAFFGDADKLQGVCLGYDHTSEHEWGYKDISNAFGIAPPDHLNAPWGIESCTTTQYPRDSVKFVHIKDGKVVGTASNGGTIVGETTDEAALIYKTHWGYPSTHLQVVAIVEQLLKHELRIHEPFHDENYKHDQLATAWSGQDFGIRVRGEGGCKALRELADAFINKDVAICSRGLANPFGGAGLTFLIASRYPKELNDEWVTRELAYKSDVEEYNASGVPEALSSMGGHGISGKPYYSCGSKFIRDKEGVLRTWLNPSAQEEDNYGWFTFDDLLAWSRGEGPIPKKAQTA